jgi:hypothetical protein
MKKTTFTPSPDQLEGRIVLSGGPKFSNGAAILTEKALGQTYGLIQKAFDQYANHGQDSRRLQVDLAKAVSRIPYNRRDGLLAAVQSEATQVVADVASNAPAPVQGARQRALGDVSDFVQGEIAGGAIVMASKVQRTAARVAVSGGPQVSNGAAILTRKALGQTYGQIQKAFSQYANHGRDSGRLQVDLARAVDRIPYNRRDGLLAAVQSEATQVVADVASNAPAPVKGALQRALGDVNAFVQDEIAGGIIVVR